MEKLDLLTLDALEKAKLASVKGGQDPLVKACACICVGGSSDNSTDPGKIELDSTDVECTDCNTTQDYKKYH